MKNTKINKSELFKRAWHFYRSETYPTFSQCLKQSWKITKVMPDFTASFNECKDDLFNYANRLCNGNMNNAMDLFQETSMNIYKGFNNFNPELGESFKWWAFTSMKNTHISMFRCEKKEKYQLTDVDDVQYINVRSKYNSDVRVKENELNNVLNGALSKLSNTQRTVIEMIIKGYSYKEICKKTEMPLGTVQAVINRARKKLRMNVHISQLTT